MRSGTKSRVIVRDPLAESEEGIGEETVPGSVASILGNSEGWCMLVGEVEGLESSSAEQSPY